MTDREAFDLWWNSKPWPPGASAWDAWQAALASERAKHDFEPEGPCVEEDGCPTELAVLQRFWRAERAKQAEPVAWLHTNEYGGEGMLSFGPRKGEYQRSVPLYAAPPAVQAPKPELRWTGNYLQTTANRPTAAQAQMAQQAEPVTDPFADVRDKRIGELTEEQHDRAVELWLRNNKGYTSNPDAIERVMRVIDRLRAAPPAVQAEPVLSVIVAGGKCVGIIFTLNSVWDDGTHLLYASPPADDEAVRLLRWVREKIVSGERVIDAIDAYLAKVGDNVGVQPLP